VVVWVQPEFNEVSIEIESISRLGLVTVQYNQPLEMLFDKLIVAYAQESYEAPIDFNWTFVGNTTESF
jgi:hypothetical protein